MASSKAAPLTGAQALTNRIALRPPRTVKSVLTTMLDQLTVSQRMLMKTASAIGPSFDNEMLRGACPIEAHLSRFAQDLEDLEQLAMIRRIDTFIGGVPSKSQASSHMKVKFEFNHGFMCGVIREQLLRGQLDKLNARIADFREQQQKELRHKFFSKANESLCRSPQLTISVSPGEGFGIRRALTPTGARTSTSRSPAAGRRRLMRRNSHSGIESYAPQNVNSSGTPTTSDSSSESSSTQALQDESEYEEGLSPVLSPGNAAAFSTNCVPSSTWRTLPTVMRLKTGRVLVKKHCSVFSHLKLKGLKNARQWKTRYAVLQNARLLLQYEENGPLGLEQGTSLSLKDAKVSACDPEMATKVNCFQVEVSEWTKGKNRMHQRRAFIIGVDNEEEVENWVFMIRYVIESLESYPQQ